VGACALNGQPQGCSLRSHRLRRLLKPLTPTLSPAVHSAMPSMLHYLHFGLESASQKRMREISFGEYPQIVRLAHFYQKRPKIIIEYKAALDKLVQIGPRYSGGPLQFIEQCFNGFLVEAKGMLCVSKLVANLSHDIEFRVNVISRNLKCIRDIDFRSEGT
jgi:hypothetical protein